ncbi:MAG: hypothetical protein ACOVOQ_09665 [Flavobacterium sp.]
MKEHRPIKIIAFDIWTDWESPSNSALPYLQAMMSLHDINDRYFHDSARSIVTYFLSNASRYKGDKARWYKRELKEMLKDS